MNHFQDYKSCSTGNDNKRHRSNQDSSLVLYATQKKLDRHTSNIRAIKSSRFADQIQTELKTNLGSSIPIQHSANTEDRVLSLLDSIRDS